MVSDENSIKIETNYKRQLRKKISMYLEFKREISK